MSWSFYAVGQPEAVRRKVAEELAKESYCAQPEEEVRKKALSAID
jgi:hypothetical protein